MSEKEREVAFAYKGMRFSSGMRRELIGAIMGNLGNLRGGEGKEILLI